MTYDKLVAAVAAWINDPQIEPTIPTFITLAEALINRRLAREDAPAAMVRATCTIDAEYAAAPEDLARLFALTHADGEDIENVTPVSFRALAKAEPAARGRPRRFMLSGAALRFHPVPDRAYAVELCYQAKLSPLTPANAANWVSTHHPDVYLYGALLQSAPFLGEDGRVATWSTLFAHALDGMAASEAARRGEAATPGFSPNMPHRAGAGR